MDFVRTRRSFSSPLHLLLLLQAPLWDLLPAQEEERERQSKIERRDGGERGCRKKKKINRKGGYVKEGVDKRREREG